MDTVHTENIKLQTSNLYNSLSKNSIMNYGSLISSISLILENTRPLSLGYSTRAINHALFSSSPKTRYFVGWDARATWLLRSLLPDRILDAMFTSSIAHFETIKNDFVEINNENVFNLGSKTQLNFKKQF